MNCLKIADRALFSGDFVNPSQTLRISSGLWLRALAQDSTKKIGAEARHKEEILQKGYGYRLMVKNFRHLLSRVGFKEEKIVKELEKILFEDYGTLFEKVVALIAKKAKLP